MLVVAYEFQRRFRPAFQQFRKRGSHFLRREEQNREIGAVAKRIVGKGGLSMERDRRHRRQFNALFFRSRLLQVHRDNLFFSAQSWRLGRQASNGTGSVSVLPGGDRGFLSGDCFSAWRSSAAGAGGRFVGGKAGAFRRRLFFGRRLLFIAVGFKGEQHRRSLVFDVNVSVALDGFDDDAVLFLVFPKGKEALHGFVFRDERRKRHGQPDALFPIFAADAGQNQLQLLQGNRFFFGFLFFFRRRGGRQRLEIEGVAVNDRLVFAGEAGVFVALQPRSRWRWLRSLGKQSAAETR